MPLFLSFTVYPALIEFRIFCNVKRRPLRDDPPKSPLIVNLRTTVLYSPPPCFSPRAPAERPAGIAILIVALDGNACSA